MERPVKRKLVTILSADVAEYSRMMAENEEQTTNTFRAHKLLFESLVPMHEGRIFNTAGDAILAEFGSVVEAVRCATEIQSALRTRNNLLPLNRRLAFRIGINLGDVIIQGSDLLGDGVNVAARLQAAAEPGGICISGSVFDQIQNKLTLSVQSMGESNFKNIPQPVRTFAIRDAAGGVVLPTPKFNGTASFLKILKANQVAFSAFLVCLLAITAGFLLTGHPRTAKGHSAGQAESIATDQPSPPPPLPKAESASQPQLPSAPPQLQDLQAQMQNFMRKYGMPKQVRESMEAMEKGQIAGAPDIGEKISAHLELLKTVAAQMDAAGVSTETLPAKIQEMQKKLQAKAQSGQMPPEVPPLMEQLKKSLDEGDLLEADSIRKKIEAAL